MAAPTMTRTAPLLHPQPSDADLSSSSPPSPPRNPWRIHISGTAAAAAATVTLVGEPPSSWPPLSPCQGIDSPSNPSLPEAEKPTAADIPSSSSTSSLDPASLGEITPSMTPPPPPPVASAPSSPLHALVPPPSSGRAAVTEQHQHQHRAPLRPSAPPHWRGRNQRFNNQRGGNGGPRPNNNYNHRPPAPALVPAWRPDWSGFNSMPQHPYWGFVPGSAANVVYPADMYQYFFQYPQAYSELVYNPAYNTEQYGSYYNQLPYEMPYATSMSSPTTGTPAPQLVPSFPEEVTSLPEVVTQDDQFNAVKDRVRSQIEYYFSDVNLVKDSHLKRQMDSQGWVDVGMIAAFPRVTALTGDISLIKDVLKSSNVVEIQENKMRKKHEWNKWVSRKPSQAPLVTGMRNIKLGD